MFYHMLPPWCFYLPLLVLPYVQGSGPWPPQPLRVCPVQCQQSWLWACGGWRGRGLGTPCGAGGWPQRAAESGGKRRRCAGLQPLLQSLHLLPAAGWLGFRLRATQSKLWVGNFCTNTFRTCQTDWRGMWWCWHAVTEKKMRTLGRMKAPRGFWRVWVISVAFLSMCRDSRRATAGTSTGRSVRLCLGGVSMNVRCYATTSLSV